MFYQVKNPPQWMLDGLLNEDKTDRPCPDCQVKVGKSHRKGCDTSHCLKTGIQRLQCDCGECGEDLWTGHWPGIELAYQWKLVCYDTATGYVMLDLNAASIVNQMQKRGASEKEIQWAIGTSHERKNLMAWKSQRRLQCNMVRLTTESGMDV